MSCLNIDSIYDIPGKFRKEDGTFIDAPIDKINFEQYTSFFFPLVTYKTNDSEREWQLIIGLRDRETQSQKMPILLDYYNNANKMDKICGVYITIYGFKNGKKTMSGVKTITEGKNIGNINETNVFNQLMLVALKIYNDYVKSKITDAPTFVIDGKTIVKNIKFDKGENGELIQLNRNNQNTIYLSRKPPMLLEVYGRVKMSGENKGEIVDENIKRLGLNIPKKTVIKSKDEYDNYDLNIYVQPKIDDIRIVTRRKNLEIAKLATYSHTDKNMEIEMYTRGLIECGKIPNILYEISLFYQSEYCSQTIYFDGGIYSHNKSLEEINSIVRTESSEGIGKDDIEYYLFDLFGGFTSEDSLIGEITNMGFHNRMHLLQKIYSDVNSKYKLKYVKLLPHNHITKYSEIVPIFDNYINKGYEGIILRLYDAEYVLSYGNKRSSKTLKLKRLYDSEFEIVGFTCGQGNSESAIIWILKTKNGDRFTSVPLGTIEDRKELYIKMLNNDNLFKDKYLGKMMTVQYEELSTKKIPQRAQVVRLKID